MANFQDNPHTDIGSKLISLELLNRYHHNVCSSLGLENDTLKFIYGGTRADGQNWASDDDPISVASALSDLWDKAAEGAVTFGSGKAANTTLPDIVFNTDDGDSTNIYWINAKIGDDTVNIKLDANAFVKDSVLESVALVNISTTTGETPVKSYKVDGVAATYVPANEDEGGKLVVGDKTYYVGANFDALADGTYFHYTWKIDNGEAGITRSFSDVSFKDIYGDIKGDDYIKFDSETSTIQAQVADVEYLSDPEAVTYKYTSGPIYEFLPNHGYAEYVAEKTETDLLNEFTEDKIVSVKYVVDEDTYFHIEYVLTEKDTNYQTRYLSDGEGGAFVIKEETISTGDKSWQVDSTDETNLATAENLAEVANALQEQIDTLDAEETEYKAGANVTALPDGATGEAGIYVKTTTANGKTTVTYGAIVSTTDDIDNLFNKCVPDATNISTTSSVDDTIDGAGEYDINVGEEPTGSKTNITWTAIEP